MRLDDNTLERLEVGVLAEQVHPADRSVQHMVDLTARCISCGSWHGKTIARSRRTVDTSCVPVVRPVSPIAAKASRGANLISPPKSGPFIRSANPAGWV